MQLTLKFDDSLDDPDLFQGHKDALFTSLKGVLDIRCTQVWAAHNDI